jgi:hypothetical protein
MDKKLYTGRRPFEQHANDYQVIIDVLGGRRPERPNNLQCLVELGDVVWGVITHAWSRDPLTRPTMDHIHSVLLQAVPEHSLSSDKSPAGEVPPKRMDEVYLSRFSTDPSRPPPPNTHARGPMPPASQLSAAPPVPQRPTSVRTRKRTAGDGDDGDDAANVAPAVRRAKRESLPARPAAALHTYAAFPPSALLARRAPLAPMRVFVPAPMYSRLENEAAHLRQLEMYAG